MKLNYKTIVFFGIVSYLLLSRTIIWLSNSYLREESKYEFIDFEYVSKDEIEKKNLPDRWMSIPLDEAGYVLINKNEYAIALRCLKKGHQ